MALIGLSPLMLQTLEVLAKGFVIWDADYGARLIDEKNGNRPGNYVLAHTVRALERRKLIDKGVAKANPRYAEYRITADGMLCLKEEAKHE